MEGLERSFFQADTDLDRGELPNSSITFSPPDHPSVADIFKEDSIEPAKEEHKPLEIGEGKEGLLLPHSVLVLDDATLELHQMCRGCLNITDVSNMQDTFIGGVTSLVLYEEVSKIKVERENIPTMMCANCIQELEKINNFIKMLKHSYTILARATLEIKQLNEETFIDMDTYYLKKTNILQNALTEKFAEAHGKDIRNIEAQDTSKNYQSNDGVSDNADGSFSVHNDSGSSDDEIPLSERFKTNLNKRRVAKKFTKEIKRKKIDNRKSLPKKRCRTSKENLENLPEWNIANRDSQKNNPNSKEQFGVQETCPLCSKSIRLFSKHLQSVHSLDWSDSRCLKCSYQNMEKDELVTHSSQCTKTEPKDEDPEYFESDELKVEFCEEMDDKDEYDPDFELDEPDRVELEEYEDIGEMENPKTDQSNRKRGRNRKYSCNKCNDISFTQYEDIELHLKTIHSLESKCILCEQKFTNSFSLLYHLMVKHGKLKCCRLCLLSFKNSDELNAHYKSEEHNTKCTVCGEQFKNRKALYEHRRKKHLNPQMENQKYKCPECPKEFANQNNIRRHIMVAHNDLRFLCDTCGQSYTTKRNLKLHIQKFHEGVQVQNKNTKKNFFCEACGRELKIFHKYAIAMHRAKHKGYNFVCKKCYDCFPTEEDFKKHVEDFGHQLYNCDKCQSQFVREENFKIHLKNHDAPGWNKNMFATWGKSAKLRNEKGEFVCSYCPKVFKDKQRLDNHVRVHTNERPYKCHICSKGFKTWIHRKTHLNIHLGIKKWVCKYCSKAFTNSCTLKGHEMIHTGERPHRCPECKKGFITMSAMKKHSMVHYRTGGSSYGKKDKSNPKDEDKTDSEPEENAEFIYKHEQMFSGTDVNYESFTGPPKEATVGLVFIDKELSC